jgi:hypothetical protein
MSTRMHRLLLSGTRSRLLQGSLARQSSKLGRQQVVCASAVAVESASTKETSYKAWLLAAGLVGLASEEYYRTQCCGIVGVVGATQHDAR